MKRESTTEETETTNGPRLRLILSDSFLTSRPGWWLVTLWLYVAPTAGRMDIIQTTSFWSGLVYVLFPVNLLVYAMNDFADEGIDATNPRKGNAFFGAKLSKERLRMMVRLAFVLTATPCLLLFPALSVWRERQEISDPQDYYYSKWPIKLVEWQLIYFVWFALAVLVNGCYNFEFLGKLSGKAPFETPCVFLGYSLVTVFSYFLNLHNNLSPIFQSRNNDSCGAAQFEDSTNITIQKSCNTNDESTHQLFGCNYLYWTHLFLLVIRTQFWTEYMDYDEDRKYGRRTTACFFQRRESARSLCTVVLIVEVLWNSWVHLSARSDWSNVLRFAVFGLIAFVLIEHVFGDVQKYGWLHSVKAQKALLVGQTIGGLWLLHDTWSKGNFVSR